MGASWSTDDIPYMGGKNALVTAADSEIGSFVARHLAEAGANVTIVCASNFSGERVQGEIRARAPTASVDLVVGELTSRKGVKQVANAYLAKKKPLDLLINYCGMPPLATRQDSEDGHELQYEANHLCLFALTGRLIKVLKQSSAPRVVTVSSIAALNGKKQPRGEIDFKLLGEQYDPKQVYSNVKAANIIFAFELARRYPKITSVAAHPGATPQDVITDGVVAHFVTKTFGHTAEQGALSVLRAATEPGIPSWTYYGAKRGYSGPPTEAWMPEVAKSKVYNKEFWAASVAATGVKY